MAIEESPGLGFERVKTIHGSTYKDVSTVVVIPMRGIERHLDDQNCKDGDHRFCKIPAMHYQVAAALRGMIAPMNQKRAMIEVVQVVGHEVGRAYDEAIKAILADQNLSTWKYIMTIEDDNLVPPDAHVRLLESIEETKADAVGGIYFTKGDGGLNAPMAYGDPREFAETGNLNFRPLDVAKLIERGNIVEVNGIAMGCTLYRMELFRQIPAPWFVTVADVFPEGAKCYTQDLSFCEKAKRAGKRFYVDCRVKVGHLNVETGVIY